MSMNFAGSPKGQGGAYYDSVRQAIGSNHLSVVQHLLPNGRKVGPEWIVGSIDGEAGMSMSVNYSSGVWSDFNTGHKGHDLISLWQQVRKIGFKECMDEAAAHFGIGQNTVVSIKDITRTTAKPAPVATPAPAPAQPAPVTRPDRADHIYNYVNDDGSVFAQVYRWNATPIAKKVIRPWNPATKRFESPEGQRPLYNLASCIASASPIVVVEGEKCADALIAQGFTATCCMGGAQAAERTDWTPLAGKTVIIWPDNDKAGIAYANKVSSLLTGSTIYIVKPPADVPAKWDAADATPDQCRKILDDTIARPARSTAMIIKLWPITRFTGKPKEREWLVEGILPKGVPGLFAAPGDTGKSMLTLDLALKIAADKSPGMDFSGNNTWFDGQVVGTGTVVIIAAEDTEDELHRRISGLDPTGSRRLAAGNRLLVIPMPSVGGVKTLFERGRHGGGAECTDAWGDLLAQLAAIPDLALVILDPLSSFTTADVNIDNVAATAIMNFITACCTETSAGVLVLHHFNKGDSKKPIKTPEDARLAIRGATALVDNARIVLCAWVVDEDEARITCHGLGRTYERNAIVHGAVVKSNAPASRDIVVFSRHKESGLLESVTNEYRNKGVRRADRLNALEAVIKRFGEQGHKANQSSFTQSAAQPSGRLRSLLTADEEKLIPRKAAAGLLEKLIKDKRIKLSDSGHYVIPNGPGDGKPWGTPE